MNINNKKYDANLVSFHFVLPKKKLKLLKRIAKNQHIFMSDLICKIFDEYRLLIQNKQLFNSPKKTKKRLKIVKKVESRVYISKQDYDFLTQNMLLNNYSSRAEFFREIIFAYLDDLLDCGEKWLKEKTQKINKIIERKNNILRKNHGVVKKIFVKYKHLYNMRTNGSTVFEIEFVE